MKSSSLVAATALVLVLSLRSSPPWLAVLLILSVAAVALLSVLVCLVAVLVFRNHVRELLNSLSDATRGATHVHWKLVPPELEIRRRTKVDAELPAPVRDQNT